MLQISAIACWATWVRPRVPHVKASNPTPQAGCRAAVDIVPHLIPDDGELGHRRAHKALLEAGVTAEQESEHGDHHQQQGNNAKKAL